MLVIKIKIPGICELADHDRHFDHLDDDQSFVSKSWLLLVFTALARVSLILLVLLDWSNDACLDLRGISSRV
jgi:hypothetical protein